jgi:hypothetical protein
MTEEMQKPLKNEILRILKKSQSYINRGDSTKLKALSDDAIQKTGIFQESDSLSLAVLIYSLSKLLERWGFDGEYAEQARNMLSSAQFALEEDNTELYRGSIKKLSEFAAAVDKEFRIYVQKAIEKAQIKKGSKLYEFGISAARAAELLGIGQWELMSYIGKTRIHDAGKEPSGVEARLKFARYLFA